MSLRITLIDPLGVQSITGNWKNVGMAPISCAGRYRLSGNHSYANPVCEVALSTGPSLPKVLSEIPTITPSRDLLARMILGSQGAGWNTMELDIVDPQVYVWLRASSGLAGWRIDLSLTLLGES